MLFKEKVTPRWDRSAHGSEVQRHTSQPSKKIEWEIKLEQKTTQKVIKRK